MIRQFWAIAVVAVAACVPGFAPLPSPVATSALTAAPPPAVSQPAAGSPAPSPTAVGAVTLREFPVPAGSGPHDVAPAADGGVWYTAQRSGELGWLDPRTGQTKHVRLGAGSSPHGVVVGPDGAPWVTDSGLNAIVRVDPRTSEVTRFDIPPPHVSLNTATFDKRGVLWWTGQSGWYGSLNLQGNEYNVGKYQAPRGAGPYGITATPTGDVYYASLAGDHIARIDVATERATPIDPPTANNGARRVWSDSKGNVWVSEWDAGQLGRYDPRTNGWKEWKLPGARPQAYAVFVDDRDVVWLSDFGASALVRFDPAAERFDVFPHAPNGAVRQLHGRPGEVWGALSALDKLIVATTR